MNSGDELAFPLEESDGHLIYYGLTKRELFAAMAMQGLCAAHNREGTWSHDAGDVSCEAVKRADALLSQLEKG